MIVVGSENLGTEKSHLFVPLDDVYCVLVLHVRVDLTVPIPFFVVYLKDFHVIINDKIIF